MRPSDQLSQFVRDALIAGKPRDQIEDALKQAGWAYNEARNAMESWADQDFAPPYRAHALTCQPKKPFSTG